MANVILEMKNIVKEFSGVKALKNVNIDFIEGEVHAICGENGAGKSTLMKVLSGVYPAGQYEGDILLRGKKQVFNNIKDSESKGIAIIHQELALARNMSISENIFLGREPKKAGFLIDYIKMSNDSSKLLKQLNLDRSPETITSNLGIAQQQLVEIAKALSKDAKLIIFDEPTAPLTEVEVRLLMDLIKQLRNQGVTCAYISHRLDEVMELADRVTIIRDGETITTEKIKDLTKDKIIQYMVGREMTELYPKEQIQLGEEILRVENFTVLDQNNSSRKVVKNVSLTLKKGEILGISGLVGAGRTELVSSIFGSYEGKKEGKIYLQNKEVKIKTAIDGIKNGICMVPEDRKKDGIIGILSVAENMSIANIEEYEKFKVIDSIKELEDIRKYIKLLTVKTSSVDLPLKGLSGGNQQKVVIAKNLMLKPKVLILDEPTRGVDVGAKYEIYKIITQLAKEGLAIIIVSSDLPEVLGMSDRVLVMHEGNLKGTLDNINLSQEDIMNCALGGAVNE